MAVLHILCRFRGANVPIWKSLCGSGAADHSDKIHTAAPGVSSEDYIKAQRIVTTAFSIGKEICQLFIKHF